MVNQGLGFDNKNDQPFVHDPSKYKYRENDPEFRGDPISDDLHEGPVKDRRCTDIIFLILYIAFWVASIGISIHGFKTGNPDNLASPYDPDNNHCGITKGYEAYPLVYFIQQSGSLNFKSFACVSNCPSISGQLVDCKPNSQVQTCPSGEYVYAAFQMGEMCLPKSNIINDITKELSGIRKLNENLHDLKLTYPILFAAMGFAFVIGFIFILLLRFFAKILVWFCILLYLAVIIGLGFVFYYYGSFNKDSSQAQDISTYISDNQQTLKILAYVLWVLGALSLLLFMVFCNRIRLAIAVIKTSSDFVRQVYTVLFMPICIIILGLCFFIYWFFSILYIFSSGGISQNGTTPFAKIAWTANNRAFLWFFILSFIWNMEMFIAMINYIIGKSCALWYFSKGQVTHNPISQAFYTMFRFHLGSLALGALIVTICEIIKLLFEFVHYKFRASAQMHPNCFLNFFVKCCHCCFDCFARFIRFTSHNAYIMIGLSGQGFCHSAYHVFYLMIRNPVRFSALSAIGWLIYGLFKALIALLTAFLTYHIIVHSGRYSQKIYSPVAPSVIAGAIGYLIGAKIMSVFAMSSKAILISYCIDEEIHSRKGNQAEHVPEALRDFVKNHK